MGNMGSRLRKGRAAYESSVAKKHQNLRTQEGYIRDYNKLLSMGPNKSNDFKKSLSVGRVLVSPGGRHGRDTWAEGFKFVSEWDYANRHRHWSRGHSSMNQWHYATNYRPVSSYPGLLEEFKQKAINAEMYGIPAAKKAIAGIKPMDLSYISSSRKSSRNQKAKASQSASRQAEVAAATESAKRGTMGTGLSWTVADSATSGGKESGSTKSSSEKKAYTITLGDGSEITQVLDPTSYQYLTDMRGKGETLKGSPILSIRDVSGSLGSIKLPDTSKMTEEQRGNFTKGYLESMAVHVVPNIIKDQQQTETKLEKELASVNKKLEKFQMRQTDRYGNTFYKITDESRQLTSKKEELERKLQDINNDQKVATTSLSSLDYNTMMRYLAKQDVITDDSRKKYLQYSDPSLAVLEQEVQATAYAHEQQKTKTSMISSEIQHLKTLQMNNIGGRKQSEINTFVRDLESKYGDSLTTPFDNPNAKEATVPGILKQLSSNLLPESQKKQSQLRKEQLDAASMFSKKQTTEQRMATATKTNEEAKAKSAFEEMTGIDTKGKSADQTMQEWYESMGRNPADNKSLKGFKADSSSEWFGGWLRNDTMLQRDTDLTLWAERDTSGYQDLGYKKGILQKYDAWDKANEFVGQELYSLKGDLNQYYGQFYSAPSVTKQDVSKAWFGTPTIEGDSFVGHVNQEMGGIRGGGYWVQDVRKLIKQTKEYEGTLEQKITDRETKLLELQLEQSRLKEAHRLLRPEITSAVESGVKVGNQQVDEKLTERLTSSSQQLYDVNEQVAITQAEQEYLEKSLKKTIDEREELEEQKKIREYNQLQSNIGSGAPKRQGYSSPGRPSLKQVSRTNTGSSGINEQRNRGKAKGLGGLVR